MSFPHATACTAENSPNSFPVLGLPDLLYLPRTEQPHKRPEPDWTRSYLRWRSSGNQRTAFWSSADRPPCRHSLQMRADVPVLSPHFLVVQFSVTVKVRGNSAHWLFLPDTPGGWVSLTCRSHPSCFSCVALCHIHCADCFYFCKLQTDKTGSSHLCFFSIPTIFPSFRKMRMSHMCNVVTFLTHQDKHKPSLQYLTPNKAVNDAHGHKVL